jgi:hypothetical protein
VSPSAPEKEAKEEIRKAPVTKLETSSQPPARHEATGPGDAVAEGQKTENIKIVSPSTPEKEAKEEIRKAPVTRLETIPEPPTRHEPKGPKDAVGEGLMAAPATAAGQTSASSPSIKSPYALEALINLLEKKGVLNKEDLLEEIKKLEMKRAE